MANVGNYQAAVDLFTQAINLDAKDFRFFNYYFLFLKLTASTYMPFFTK